MRTGLPGDPLFARIAWRLLPFLLLAYAVAIIDRLNISYAKLRMAADIGLDDSAYALSAAAFFLGYILFELPSNYLMRRHGARSTFTRIMLAWGLVTLAIALVRTPAQLQVARFLLGVAEAGFFPAVVLYLGAWFPSSWRARVLGAFTMAGVAAGMLGGPLAAWVMTAYSGAAGLRGWQWLFIVEGGAAVLLAMAGRRLLDDGPQQADWLSEADKLDVARLVDRPAAGGAAVACPAGASGAAPLRRPYLAVLAEPQVHALGLAFFAIHGAATTTVYWLPTLLSEAGLRSLQTIGLASALPYLGALLAIGLLGRSSDLHRERRWHAAAPMLVAGACFATLALHRPTPQLPLALMLLSVGMAAALSAVPLFWTIPSLHFRTADAPAGIAYISSVGALAAFCSPLAVAAIKEGGGGLSAICGALAALLLAGAVLLLRFAPRA